MPAFKSASAAFNKTQSQFMDNALTLSLPTCIRNARQVLAEIERSRLALQEARFSIERKKVKADRAKAALEKEKDCFAVRELEIDIAEAESQIANTMGYVQGAIRKIHNYMLQYKSICARIGKDDLTEADFEADEARYHVMRAFEQGLCAARSHGGVIDEGNHIYFHQIGINGAMAQAEVSDYLRAEQELFSAGRAPTHDMQINWLEALGDRYADSAAKYAERRGIVLMNDASFHRAAE
jgi:hypothetical protein